MNFDNPLTIAQKVQYVYDNYTSNANPFSMTDLIIIDNLSRDFSEIFYILVQVIGHTHNNKEIISGLEKAWLMHNL